MLPRIDSPELLSLAQTAQADQLAIAAGVAFSSLMEAAGTAVADAIRERWPLCAVVVLCGPGNNGGDGLVAARRLVRAGWPVRVALMGSRDQHSPALQAQAGQWTGALEPLTENVLSKAALVVDALFGAGFNRPLEPPVARLLAAVAERSLPMVAVDVPSGLEGDSGRSRGAVAAELTVTFCRRKPAHLLAPGRALCGEILVADIGIPEPLLAQLGIDTYEIGPALGRTRPSGAVADVLAPAGAAWEVVVVDELAVDEDVLALARRCARERGRVVLLDGASAVIAAPDGLALIHRAALPEMPPEALHALLEPQLNAGDGCQTALSWRLAKALWTHFPATA